MEDRDYVTINTKDPQELLRQLRERAEADKTGFTAAMLGFLDEGARQAMAGRHPYIIAVAMITAAINLSVGEQVDPDLMKKKLRFFLEQYDEVAYTLRAGKDQGTA